MLARDMDGRTGSSAAPLRGVGSGPITIGIPKEIDPREKRVGGTPASVARLRKMGIEVIVETGAGAGAGFEDAAYAEAGARVAPTAAEVWRDADVITKVRAPMAHPDGETHEADLLREGQYLISFLWPAQNKELVELLADRKATVLAMDAVPRITRAQKLDALSAMSNIAGSRRRAASSRRRSSWSARASPASPPSAPRDRSAPRSRRSTPAPSSASRWSRWARSSSPSTSRARPARARAATPRR
jgi:NAD(P) transhydrogenase subunit alpha